MNEQEKEQALTLAKLSGLYKEDEMDSCPISANDPLNLAMKRTKTLLNRKIILVSTPTVKY